MGIIPINLIRSSSSIYTLAEGTEYIQSIILTPTPHLMTIWELEIRE